MSFDLQPIMISGKEVLPLIEGGKGVAVSTGESSGAWAAAGGVGTFSAVNADRVDENGKIIRTVYHGRSRMERFDELVAQGIEGGIKQAQIAHEVSGGEGRLHMNVLWEMGGAERVLEGVMEGAKGMVHGITCGAGMPFRLAPLAAKYNVHYYPIISSARAFRALWLRSYRKLPDLLGGVVYEDPWLAGGHNGLSNSESPESPEDPYPRVAELRKTMNEFGLSSVPIVMAGGVWCLREWSNWLNNPEIGPITFQFGTRPLLTQESPISDAWKQRLLRLKEGDVRLNRFSPTGFYSSAVYNSFLHELYDRSDRETAFVDHPAGDHSELFTFGVRNKEVYLTRQDLKRAKQFIAEGFSKALQTPDSTLIFVTPEKAKEIRQDQLDCMGCLSQCKFSNWAANDKGTTGHKADPRSFCIQKTLQDIGHGDNPDNNLMFAGHAAYRFGSDPFYANGFIPTVKQLVDRIRTGD
ncbi:NAD(P)H-dependent flavin oxidoreductase YrpB, nitropropane dioxygenase family [Mariprofundus ferrinatatus]|uniref:NAD(P)H-dependent flavin oxidoreductase YrpB, nitropropane dioxygenase family n=1 Tax=Mariprofundus ferrinatatus TaxID=1921087 RepID=A0A2K8L782_9PROT|nr:nitronate monooxygenase [Mariprofundus ferrinatatus]ATX82109.1 NAD(P)H-dependent flavin oxidoreductase YrpB, nitropropane dioxygenase family [Mariprofundus ferrinatatus]